VRLENAHFPNERPTLKYAYMAILSLDPTGVCQARWTMCWKSTLSAFDITSTAAIIPNTPAAPLA
jgi:hypothetical protein